jgi:hypothetical protein
MRAFETRTELNLIQGLKVQSVRLTKDLKQEIETFLHSKSEKHNGVLSLLREKIETNEKDIFSIRNKLIEQKICLGEESPSGFQKKRPGKGNRSPSPDMHTSVITKKNLINIQNDLKNFKNEMRLSLSANESGVRERLNSLSRSIRHVQTRPPPRNE